MRATTWPSEEMMTGRTAVGASSSGRVANVCDTGVPLVDRGLVGAPIMVVPRKQGVNMRVDKQIAGDDSREGELANGGTW
jgi:hypothetical protein